jgi:sugar lactone lactonase YvrE/preprotein translocase subunit SecG
MLSNRLLRRTSIIVIATFFLFYLEPNLMWSRQSQEKALTRARQLVRDGAYEEAIKLLQGFIAKNQPVAEQKKNVAEAYYIMAKINYINGEMDISDANIKHVFEVFAEFSVVEEPDQAFRARTEKIRGEVLAAQGAKAEEKPLEIKKKPEKEQPTAMGKTVEVKKRKFPWLLAIGGAVLLLVGVILLSKGKAQATTPTPPSVQYGNISISSDPKGTKVYLDGSDTGKVTDCTLSNVTVGTHQLKLVLENYGQWDGSVEVKANQTTNVSATLAGFKYEFVTKWGRQGAANGEFYSPFGVDVDTSGNVYVTDTQNARIQKFDSIGNFLAKWGSYGSGDRQFNEPMGITLDNSGNVYVNDRANNRIQKYTSAGDFVGWWGRDNSGYSGWHNPGSGRIGVSGSGDGQFNRPNGIAVDGSGYVYVADSENNRIQKFDSGGGYVDKWGSAGAGDAQFCNPYDIAIGSAAYVYVADMCNSRIQKFSSSGSFVSKWGNQGSGDSQFSRPTGIGVDISGNVFVSDFDNHRVQKFSSTAAFMTKWGSLGTGDGSFNFPGEVTIDSSGYVYVADTYNHRIQKFRITTQTSLTVTITYTPVVPNRSNVSFIKTGRDKKISQTLDRSKPMSDLPDSKENQSQAIKERPKK